MKRGTAWSDQEADQRVKYTQCTPEFVEWATAHEQNRDGAWVDPANRMSEQAIAQAEAKWGIVFPPDYRAFLSLAGPGKSMIRWDGTQDKAIAELYAKLEESRT
jgi:cell wall assembly regulator SMI1